MRDLAAGPADRGPRVAMRAGWVALRQPTRWEVPLGGVVPQLVDVPQATFEVEAVGSAVWLGDVLHEPPCARHDQVVALTEDSVPTTVGSAEDGMKLLLVPFRAVLAVVLW